MRARTEQPRQQPGDRQVRVQRLPMQAVTRAQNLDLRKLFRVRVLQPLRQLERKGEGAAIRQIDDDSPRRRS